MSINYLGLLIMLSACATPTAKILKEVLPVGTTTPAGPACPVTEGNPNGVKKIFDSTKYVCPGATLSSCFQLPDPVEERACDRAAATKSLAASEHCKAPAQFVYLVEGGYVPFSDAVAGQRVTPTPNGERNPDYGDPVVRVCGSLPQN